MINQRYRVVVWSAMVLAAIWLLAAAGYLIAQHWKMTADKVRTYLESVDFSRLSAAERDRALQQLADMLNALSLEERRQARLDQLTAKWFKAMTEAEKGKFLEATMPTGFKQMLASFEQLPDDQRQRIVDRALKQLNDAQARGGPMPVGGRMNGLSDDLRQKITKIGLQSFYSQSSAQTKAELAPVLEQMQRMMQNGAFLHGGSHP